MWRYVGRVGRVVRDTWENDYGHLVSLFKITFQAKKYMIHS